MFFTGIQLVSDCIPFVYFFNVSEKKLGLGIAEWINAIHKNAIIFINVNVIPTALKPYNPPVYYSSHNKFTIMK